MIVVVVVVVVVVSDARIDVRCAWSQRRGNATTVTETIWWQVTWESSLATSSPVSNMGKILFKQHLDSEKGTVNCKRARGSNVQFPCATGSKATEASSVHTSPRTQESRTEIDLRIRVRPYVENVGNVQKHQE